MLAVLMALVITVEPARLPQQSPSATARVQVSDGKAHKIHLWASTGTISDALDLGGGRWEAVYTAPPGGRPRWAVIGAWDEEGDDAAAVSVALEGRTEFPADTDPGAQVTVQVGARHASGHADREGHAHVTALVSPDARSARVTAVDAAGNTTIEEVKLDAAPGGVWLVAPPEIGEGQPVRVLAFATGGAAITLRARGGALEIVESRPGVVVARVRARDHVRLTATAEPGRATAEMRYRPKPPPPPTLPPPALPPPPKLVEPRWEVGASVGARYSGDFVGAGVAVAYRRHLRGRWHLGADLFGVYTDGNADHYDVRAGALGARVVAELRLPVAPLVAVVLDGSAGGAFAWERRTPVLGSVRNRPDGAPSIGVGAGIVTRAGPGLVTLRLGFAWTPLIGLALANLDGAVLSAGYRYGRW